MASRHLRRADVIGDQARRVELNGDLPNPSALHRDLADVGQPGEARAHGELGQIAQHERIGAGELVLQHREDRRGEPLRAEVERRREARTARHASRPCTWLSANCMSALGRKSRLSSAEPRTVRVRMRRSPRMPLSASSSGRVTATVICSASKVPPRASTTMRG